MEKKIPRINRECYALLDEMLSEEEMQTIVEKGTAELHFTLGLWIRNNWLYPQSSEETKNLLKTFSKEPQFYHPDDCSSIILDAYRKHLKRKKKKMPEASKKCLAQKIRTGVDKGKYRKLA